MKMTRRPAPLSCLAFSLGLLLIACFFASLDPVAAKPAAQSPEPTTYTIPFQYDPDKLPWIVVQVRINGNPPLPFIVDTGTTDAMIIDRAAARQLHLPDGMPTADGRQAVILKSIVLPGVNAANDIDFEGTLDAEIDNIPQFLSDARSKEGDPGIAGIIGCAVLAESLQYTEIDFIRKTLVVSGQPFTQIPPNSAVLPLHKPTPYEQYLVDIRHGDKSAGFKLDTGAAGSVVPPDFETLADSAGSYKHVFSAYGNITVATDVFVISDLRVGNQEFHNMQVEAASSKAPDSFPPPLLGLDTLRNFDVYLDFVRHKMTLSPISHDTDSDAPASGSQNWPNPTFGVVFVGPPGQILMASHVTKGSLSDKAGLKEGDQIVKIGGQDTASMTTDQMSGLLNQPSVDLTIRRKNVTPDIDLKITQP